MVLNREDSATWSDGTRAVMLHAGFGVDPCEVYVPPEAEWRIVAPPWARQAWDRVVEDIRAIGVRVVVCAGASVTDLDDLRGR